MSPLAQVSFLFCLAVVLFASESPAQTTSENDGAQRVAEAIQANHNAEAVAEADKILTEHPKDCAAFTLRGVASVAKDRKAKGAKVSKAHFACAPGRCWHSKQPRRWTTRPMLPPRWPCWSGFLISGRTIQLLTPCWARSTSGKGIAPAQFITSR